MTPTQQSPVTELLVGSHYIQFQRRLRDTLNCYAKYLFLPERGQVILGDLNHWAQGWIDWNILLDMDGGPTHPGPGECEGLIKCGDDAMIIADTTFANTTVGTHLPDKICAEGGVVTVAWSRGGMFCDKSFSIVAFRYVKSTV